jgi:hypothetical protein
MHIDHGLPVFETHLVKDAITQDAGVVDHGIQPAEGSDGIGHHALGIAGIGHAAAVGDGPPSRLGDLIDDALRRGEVMPCAMHGGTKVVDHHGGPGARHVQGNGPADASSSPGHQDHLVVHGCCHVVILMSYGLLGNGCYGGTMR